MRFTALCLALAVCVGCGAKSYHVATVSIVGAHASLETVRDLANTNVCGQPTAPADHCLSTAERQALAVKLSHGFDVDMKVAKLVFDWNGADPRPDFAPLLADITGVIQAVVDSFSAQAKAKAVAMLGGK